MKVVAIALQVEEGDKLDVHVAYAICESVEEAREMAKKGMRERQPTADKITVLCHEIPLEKIFGYMSEALA